MIRTLFAGTRLALLVVLTATFLPVRELFAAEPPVAVTAVAKSASAVEPLPEKIRFNDHIRPILSNRCFACHGPDEAKREGELRLDQRAAAVDAGALVPGKPDKSALIYRVTTHDPDEVMPPPTAKKPPVTAREIELLKRWIADGAEYEQHWAFIAPRAVEPPKIAGRDAITPIDAFVLAELRKRGILEFNAPADKASLLRRVTFDLTGLPPTPAELDAFLADESPTAFETVVDRLLASPRYGERMAVDWLDAARYADTHGYQADRYRAMWPYRDWVVNAFNANLPYDEFARDQIAGDLLPNASKSQRLATAFNRLHSQNEEGGIVEEEFRVAYVADRVNTFGTIFLGLTFECTRCHDHKFDPLTQKDYYSLFAFFQNIAESGQTPYFTSSMPTPTVLLSTDEQDKKLEELERQIQNAEHALTDLTTKRESEFTKWAATRGDEPPIPGCVGRFNFDDHAKNQYANSVDPSKPGKGHDAPPLVEGKRGKAIALDGENSASFPGIGHFTRATPFTLTIRLAAPKPSPRAVVLHHSRAPIDAGSRGYDLLLEENRVAFGLYHFWPGNALKVRTRETLAKDAWTDVAVVYDGSSRAGGVRMYLNGEPAELEVLADSLWKDTTYGGEPELTIGQRFRDNGFKGGKVDELAVFDRALSQLEIELLSAGDDTSADLAWKTPFARLSASQQSRLRAYYFAAIDAETRTARDALFKLRDEQRKLIDPIPEAMAMQELPQPKPAYILKRGNYDQHGAAVTADVPAVLPPFPAEAPRNRLGLAQWLTAPDHPLFGRTAVNRTWQMLFGRGLVETSDNFGSQGDRPSHTELLDWLARDFAAGGWDRKRLLKTIVMSETYRQGTQETTEQRAKDPDDRWLSRTIPRRLTSEMLRDGALATAGLLNEKQGGPAVYPYQPAGIWDIASNQKNYPQSKGDDLYRRSLYTYWKRTIPPPSMMTLDGADRSYCTVKRQSTSTPLQALVLLNDPQFVEAARLQAQRMLKEGGTTNESRTAWLFRLIVARPPSSREAKILTELYAEQLARYEKDEDGAKKLLTVGGFKADPTLKPSELAAATIVAQLIANLDDAVRLR